MMVVPGRRFVFFNESNERAVCLKELEKLPKDAQDRFHAVIEEWIQDGPSALGSSFKVLKGTKGLYEFRVRSQSDAFRLIFLVDQGTGVGLTAFQKKKQRTPPKFMKRALNRQTLYQDSRG